MTNPRRHELDRSALRRRFLAVMALASCLILGAGGVSAANTGANHCIAPSGVDLNEFYGVSEQIVAPFCTKVASGEQWTVTVLWFMAPTFEVVPEGFVPAGATPIEDFVAKFLRVEYVVDPGTKHEKTYVFKNKRHLWTGVIPGGFPAVNTLTLGTLQPLSIGQHVVKTYWVLGAMHCDGLGDVVGANCLPAGATLFRTDAFEVTADQR